MIYQKRKSSAGSAIRVPLYSSAWLALFLLLRATLQS